MRAIAWGDLSKSTRFAFWAGLVAAVAAFAVLAFFVLAFSQAWD